MHDPHLAHHFAQKPARTRMKALGFVTKDDRAVCSLKEFNQYRKYLYNQFMDRIHIELTKLNERAKDDLTLKRVDTDVARRQQIFIRSEKAREHLERVAQENADEWAAKKRAAKELERKIQARMKYLAEYNEKVWRDRAAKAAEKANRIKQRVQAAAEMELRRKITMVRQWRTNEKKRLNRLKQERETKKRRLEEEANNKWKARVQAQNMKIQEEALLLKLYTEDMGASAKRRAKKAEVYAYNTDLELQRIRLANWKQCHGGTAKAASLVKKMGLEFEKTKRGAKGMTPELAQQMAQEAMKTALSTQGDVLMILGQARAIMDIVTVVPPAPIRILDEVLEYAVMEFARRRVHQLFENVERVVLARATTHFYSYHKPSRSKRGSSRRGRFSLEKAIKVSQMLMDEARRVTNSIGFDSEIVRIPNPSNDDEIEVELKSVKDRPPTPVPSLSKLAEVTFSDRIEDLPEPVAIGTYLPERRKLLDMVNCAARLLTKTVSQRVEKGMDLETGNVTLPHMRHPMEWGEAVEALSTAVVNNRVQPDNVDIRHTAEFLTQRVLKTLRLQMNEEKLQRISDESAYGFYEEYYRKTDFYVPGEGS